MKRPSWSRTPGSQYSGNQESLKLLAGEQPVPGVPPVRGRHRARVDAPAAATAVPVEAHRPELTADLQNRDEPGVALPVLRHELAEGGAGDDNGLLATQVSGDLRPGHIAAEAAVLKRVGLARRMAQKNLPGVVSHVRDASVIPERLGRDRGGGELQLAAEEAERTLFTAEFLHDGVELATGKILHREVVHGTSLGFFALRVCASRPRQGLATIRHSVLDSRLKNQDAMAMQVAG